MMTKDEEIAKVQEIFAGLEKGSYIEMTLRGADKVILKNIEDDSACNLVEDAEGYASKTRELESKIKEMTIKYLKDSEEETNLRNSIAKERDSWLEGCQKWKKIAEERERQSGILEKHSIDLEDELAQKELEIVKLKAKLYDLMILQSEE